VAEDVLGLERVVLEGNFGDEVDQAGQRAVDLFARVVFFQHAFELGVFLLDGFERVVEQATDAVELVFEGLAILYLQHGAVGDLGVILDEVPARQRGHPEHVLLGVVVARFEFLFDQIGAIRSKVVVILRIGECGLQFFAALLEGIGYVLEKDQAEHNMLVHGGVKHRQQLVSRRP